MASQDIHVGDTGTIFEITAVDSGAVVDISTQTALQITFKKPDNTTLVKSATLTTDGTDGKFQYSTLLADLDIPGTWKLQGKITMPTWTGYTSEGEFEVHNVL